MSRIIIVSELFYPDGTSTAHVLTKIADHLAKEHDIMVLAGPESYSSDCVEGIAGEKPYPIQRITAEGYDKNKLPSRALRFLVTSLKLGRHLWIKGRKDDDVLIVTNPATFPVLAAVIKRLRGFRLHILIHDVFPENAVAAGVVKSQRNLLYRLSKATLSKAFRSADTLIVLGRDMKEVFEHKFRKHKKQPSIRIIENWADPVPAAYGPAPRKDDKLTILYAGNVGRCQGIDRFIRIFEKAANPNLRLVIRGGGAMAEDVRKLAAKSPADIVVGDSYSRDEQFDILGNCDIGLVSLSDGMYGLGVPSKAYNLMAAGKPILFVGDPQSEIALTISEKDLGFVFDNSDEAGLTDWLASLSHNHRNELETKGINGILAAQNEFSERTILAKYSQLFS